MRGLKPAYRGLRPPTSAATSPVVETRHHRRTLQLITGIQLIHNGHRTALGLSLKQRIETGEYAETAGSEIFFTIIPTQLPAHKIQKRQETNCGYYVDC